MSLVRKRRSMVILILVLVSVLASGAMLHEAISSPSESLTGRLAQALSSPPTTSASAKIVLIEGGTGPVASTVAGDTLVACFDAGDTRFSEIKTTALKLRNGGDAPLILRLDGVSCGCFKSIRLNGGIMAVRERSATLLAGEAALLELKLQANPEEIRLEDLPKDGRFGLTFTTAGTDLPKLRVEITSRLVPDDQKATGPQSK